MSATLNLKLITEWEERFGELTSEERELLAGLGPVGVRGEQHRHVLIMYLAPMECPACQHQVPPRQALGRPIDHGKLEDVFTCPHCDRGLSYTVPFVGRTFWRLAKPLGRATEAELKG